MSYIPFGCHLLHNARQTCHQISCLRALSSLQHQSSRSLQPETCSEAAKDGGFRVTSDVQETDFMFLIKSLIFKLPWLGILGSGFGQVWGLECRAWAKLTPEQLIVVFHQNCRKFVVIGWRPPSRSERLPGLRMSGLSFRTFGMFRLWSGFKLLEHMAQSGVYERKGPYHIQLPNW